MRCSYLGDLLAFRFEEAKALLLRQYRRNHCSVVDTAATLGIHEKHLWRLVRQYRLGPALRELKDQRTRMRTPPEYLDVETGGTRGAVETRPAGSPSQDR